MDLLGKEIVTANDIKNYNDWMSNKNTRHLRGICRMIETDEKYRPGRWNNGELRIKLIKDEIKRRDKESL